nr:acyltransferase family protein [uncultured Stomatobaculum sp.]
MRAKEIDGMKGALIFLVVLGHFLLPLLGFGARSINLPFDLIYSFHMPAFVFLSGLFAGHALRSPRHWCKRCLTLLWLYIFFKWLVFYPEKIAYHMPGSLPDFWHESGTPWFVLALFLWTLALPLFALLRRVFPTAPVLLLILGLSLRLGDLDARLQLMDFLALDRVIAFAPFFYGGAFLGEKRFSAWIKNEGFPQWVLMVVAAGLALYFALHSGGWLHPYQNLIYGVWYTRLDMSAMPELFRTAPWLLRLLWYLASGVISAGFFVFGKLLVGLPKFGAGLAALGERSLPIYMLHRPVRDIGLLLGYPAYFAARPRLAFPLLFLLSLLFVILFAAEPVYRLFLAVQKLPGKALDVFFGNAEKQR